MIVGREDELRSIVALLDAVDAGGSGSLVLRGEAGIGKSSLLDAAAEHARAHAFTVVRATGLQSEAELAYSGLLELCRPVLDAVELLVEPQRRALRSALALGPAAEGDRFAVAAATLGLLAEVAEHGPLLVVADDAQWLDGASAEALWFALRRLDADRVAALVGVRAGHDDRLPGGLAEAQFDELRLDGLGAAAIGSLLAARGQRVPATVVEAVHTSTDGNPLAVTALARSLSSAQLSGHETLADPLQAPGRLRDLFGAEVAALAAPGRAALLVLAASGSDGHAAVVRALAVLGLGIGDLLEAEGAGLVVLTAASATFRHPLVRSAVYHSATPSERRAAHAALAEAAVAGSERESWHRAEAALAPDEHVALGLERAAGSALARGGSLAAATAFGRAASLSPGSDARARRLLRGADAFWAAGATTRASAMVAEAAQACRDPRLLGAIRQLEGHIAIHTTSPQLAHDLLVREAQAIAGLDPARAATMIGTAAEAALYLNDYEQTLDTARIGRRLAPDDHGIGGFLVAALMGCGLVGTGALEQGRGELRRAIALAAADAEVGADQRVLGWLVPVQGFLDEFGAALETAKLAEGRARASGALGELVYVLPTRAAYEYLFGDWQQAYAHITESVQLARECGQTIDRILALHGLAELEAARGHDDACHAAVAECGQHIGELEGFREWPAFALGLLALGRGDAAGAIGVLGPVVSLTRGQGQHRPVMAAFDLVEAHVLAGDRASATTILDAVERSYVGRDWELAGLARGRGMLAAAGYDDAFGRSLQLLSRLGMRFEAARTRLCFGERLRRDGRRSESRPLLRSAFATFDELGARPWADRAANELRASGEVVRRTADTRDELTARELQVALQAAEGKTNREVGAALFLSPKTVDIYLSRAYRKLGIHSRGKLRAALGRIGVAPPEPE